MKEKRRLSLATKLNLATVGVILVVAAGLLAISYHIQSRRSDQIYFSNVEEAAKQCADILSGYNIQYLREQVDSDEFRAVREKAVAANDETIIVEWLRSKPSGIAGEEWYQEVMENPNVSQDEKDMVTLYGDYDMIITALNFPLKNSNLTYSYLQYMKDGVTYTLMDQDLGILGIGAAEEPVAEFADMKESDAVPATVYKSQYGWLCSAYEPVIDAYTGEVCASVGVDMDMNRIVEQRHLYLVNTIVMFLIVTGACILVNIYLVRRIAVKPLKRLAEAACGFGKDSARYTKEDVISVDIPGNDEIGDLYREIRDMQTRIVDYTDDLERLSAEKAKIGTEMKLAANIQTAMLPDGAPDFQDHPEFSLRASMDPAREVGGDFYDYFFVDRDHLALVIADVSGKGIPAALFMMSAMILLRTQTKAGTTPAAVLEVANDHISRSNIAKMFVTVWMGILDLRTGGMICANAGHEYPAIREAGGSFQLYRDKHGFVVGGMEGMKYRDYELKLNPGDEIFVYTDGVPEANNQAKEFYGNDRMIGALNAAESDAPADILRSVRSGVDEFAGGAEQFDDLTMLCVRYNG